MAEHLDECVLENNDALVMRTQCTELDGYLKGLRGCPGDS